MSKHTPGPWNVEYLDGNGQAVVKASFIEIATCWHHSVTSIEKEMHANARLIAAAPELLEALELVISNAESAVFEDWLARVCPSGDASAVQYDWLHSSDYSDFCVDWKEAHAAIDKATGEKC